MGIFTKLINIFTFKSICL